MSGYAPYNAENDYAYAPGIYPATECLLRRPEAARRVLLSSQARHDEGMAHLLALCHERGVRTETADRALRRLSEKDNCYAAAVFTKFEDTLCADSPHIVLVSPSDRGNLGSVIRTALGLGVRDVALVRPCADLFHPKTVRATMGALFSARVRMFGTFDDYRALYPRHTVYPFMTDGAVPLGGTDIYEPFALVFGNESSGLPPVFHQAGISVRIPQSGVDSLNLSAAAAIGLYAFTSGRGGAGHGIHP